MLGRMTPASRSSLMIFSISFFWVKGYLYGQTFGGCAPGTKVMLWSCSPLEGGSSWGLSKTCRWLFKTYCISGWIWIEVGLKAWMALNWVITPWWLLFINFSILCELMIEGAPTWSPQRVCVWLFCLKLIYNSWKSIMIRPSVRSHSAPKTMSHPPMLMENMWVFRW